VRRRFLLFLQFLLFRPFCVTTRRQSPPARPHIECFSFYLLLAKGRLLLRHCSFPRNGRSLEGINDLLHSPLPPSSFLPPVRSPRKCPGQNLSHFNLQVISCLSPTGFTQSVTPQVPLSLNARSVCFLSFRPPLSLPSFVRSLKPGSWFTRSSSVVKCLTFPLCITPHFLGKSNVLAPSLCGTRMSPLSRVYSLGDMKFLHLPPLGVVICFFPTGRTLMVRPVYFLVTIWETVNVPLFLSALLPVLTISLFPFFFERAVSRAGESERVTSWKHLMVLSVPNRLPFFPSPWVDKFGPPPGIPFPFHCGSMNGLFLTD